MFLQTKFKKNSAAVKWYQESLSLDGKAQVLVKHATEQQKYWQSLSLEDKAQMLTNKADTERYWRESLPLEKKVKNLKTDAAAHKKQWVSLSPDDKVQILNKDADAHKKKQESLSPEDKDLFVNDNTAAQHKHRKYLPPDQKNKCCWTIKQQESLSPKQKGQVLIIDAAAHKKQYELLPLEKKARHMETKAEQSHEHLTEEEKKIYAQISSVSATLYKTVDLDKWTVDSMWTFLQGSNTGIGLFLLLFNRSLCGNIQQWITTRCWWISHVESHFKFDRESHWARRSNALSRDILKPWPITCKNCCLWILLWTAFECR
jgi:hypothetical protein